MSVSDDPARQAAFPISLEFFPPKTPEGVAKLAAVRQQLYALKPEFCSVTFGAGGSTQEGTFGTVAEILAEGVDAASHFSCIGATRAKTREQLALLRKMGVKRLVALRGDLPSGYGIGGEFQYASDLVAFIRAETGDDFRIEVAAYPEMHPQARSPEADLQAFAAKVKRRRQLRHHAVLLQRRCLFPLRRRRHALGLNVPIVPGIMPITSSTQLMRFSDACGAEIPRWISPAAAKLWRRRRVDQGLWPGRGHRLCEQLRGRRARPALLHDEPGSGHAGNMPAIRLNSPFKRQSRVDEAALSWVSKLTIWGSAISSAAFKVCGGLMTNMPLAGRPGRITSPCASDRNLLDLTVRLAFNQGRPVLLQRS